VVLKIHDYGGLWSYKRGGLSLEVSLYCKSLVHVNYGLSKEAVSDGRGLSKEGLLYIFFCAFISDGDESMEHETWWIACMELYELINEAR